MNLLKTFLISFYCIIFFTTIIAESPTTSNTKQLTITWEYDDNKITEGMVFVIYSTDSLVPGLPLQFWQRIYKTPAEKGASHYACTFQTVPAYKSYAITTMDFWGYESAPFLNLHTPAPIPSPEPPQNGHLYLEP